MTQFTAALPTLLAYPHLFRTREYTPKDGGPKGAPKYEATFMFRPDSPELMQIRNIIIAEADAKYPGAIQRNPDGSVLPSPLLSLPLKHGQEYYDKSTAEQRKGREAFRSYVMFHTSCAASRPPSLAYLVNGQAVDLPLDATRTQYEDAHFYGGAHVLFQVNIVPFKAGSGIVAYLNTVTSLSRGDRVPAFSGGEQLPASQVHNQHIGQATAYDPTAGGAAAPVAVPQAAVAAAVVPQPAAAPRWF